MCWELPIQMGRNRIAVEVTAQDGATMVTYTVVVSRLDTSCTMLGGLQVRAAGWPNLPGSKNDRRTTVPRLTPAFKSYSEQTEYEVTVGSRCVRVAIIPTPQDFAACVQYQGAAPAHLPIVAANIAPGTSTCVVFEVVAANRVNSMTYRVTVNKKALGVRVEPELPAPLLTCPLSLSLCVSPTRLQLKDAASHKGTLFSGFSAWYVRLHQPSPART